MITTDIKIQRRKSIEMYMKVNISETDQVGRDAVRETNRNRKKRQCP